MTKLNAANMLMRSITLNQLITNEEAEMGLIASEDQGKLTYKFFSK